MEEGRQATVGVSKTAIANVRNSVGDGSKNENARRISTG